MDLKGYEQEKFAIADLLRSAQAIDTKEDMLRQECRDLLARLAEDRFNLLVVGRFSRGKSTLMNAVLGADLLPTGIVPLTSVITTVRYGSRKQAVLHFNSHRLSREIPLAELGEYVTQQANPGNAKGIASVEIQLPVELLRRGFFFVDSPGLGSSIAENTQTTERFLPEADAFVLVTSYDSPISEEEDRILYRVQQTSKPLFVVLNKQDTVGVEDREQVITFVRERLARFSFSRTPLIFSLSARQALQAKLASDYGSLEQSGLMPLESELFRFLMQERAHAFLTNMYRRTMELLTRYLSSGWRQNDFGALLERLRERQGACIGEGEAVRLANRNVYAATAGTVSLQLERRAGCAICSAILDAIFRFLSQYQYKLTVDKETQIEHSARGGFCPLHTWQYENIASPYGICVSYSLLAHRIAGELEQIAATEDDGRRQAPTATELPATARTCKVCEVRRKAEEGAVEAAVLAARAIKPGENSTYRACCLPHLARVTSALGSGDSARALLRAHAHLFERTAEDLQRYALRHDALRRNLTSEEERRAAQLMLLLLAGHRSVSAPWSVETIL